MSSTHRFLFPANGAICAQRERGNGAGRRLASQGAIQGSDSRCR